MGLRGRKGCEEEEGREVERERRVFRNVWRI
jgi:hypothetical protein